MFRQPPLSSVSNIFLLPFGESVWVAIVLIITVTIGILFFQWVLPVIQKQMHIFESITFVLGAACQQGFYTSFHTISGRILIISTFIASIFLFTSYAANIVALLQSPSNAIKSTSDLINSPLKLVVQDTVYNHIYYNETTDAVKKELWNKKIKPNVLEAFDFVPSGMAKMRTGLYAFQVEAHAAYQVISDTFTEREKCGLKELPAFILPRCTIPMKKNSRYREMIGQRIRWQRETGIMNREFKRWIPQKTVCAGNVGGFVSVGLTEITPALHVLLLGIALAVGILAIEIGVYHVLLKYSNSKK